MIKAVIFDCFGVLYVPASEPYYSKFPKHAQELVELRRRADYGLLDRNQFLAEIQKLTGDPPDVILKNIEAEYMPNNTLFDFIKNELRPTYKIGMLSNVGRGWMQDFFNENQLHDMFDAVVLSSDIGVAKPAPDAYFQTIEKLGFKPAECVMVDDIAENCAAAQGVGMWAVHYQVYPQAIAELKNIIASNKWPS